MHGYMIQSEYKIDKYIMIELRMKRFIFSISISMFQLASKKLPLDKVECHSKEEYLQLSNKTLNIPPFQIGIWMIPNFLHIVYPTNRLLDIEYRSRFENPVVFY